MDVSVLTRLEKQLLQGQDSPLRRSHSGHPNNKTANLLFGPRPSDSFLGWTKAALIMTHFQGLLHHRCCTTHPTHYRPQLLPHFAPWWLKQASLHLEYVLAELTMLGFFLNDLT